MGRLLCVALGVAAMSSAAAEEGLFSRPVPPLKIPPGRKVRVADAPALKRAVNGARTGDVILIADGEYRVGGLMFMRDKKNVTVCGESRDPTKVIIHGKSWDRVDHGDDILRIGACENITIAHVTFKECHAYALKVQAESFPKNINVYNCHFRDIATRGIKGSSSREGKAVKGSVRYCHFENTRVPPASWQFGGNYITGIDMMALDGWTFADNTFKNIKGRTGGARGAIFLWVRSRNVVVERNIIVDCDRGVAFGNPSGSTARSGPDMHHMTNGICRNNFIKPGPDAGVELSWVKDIKVYNNTIWRENAGGRGIRCIQKIGKTEIFNNLVRGRIALSGEATEKNNVVGTLDGLLVNPKAGDLRLVPAASKAIGRGMPVEELKDDFFGYARDAKPDIGAMEFGARPKEEARKETPGKPKGFRAEVRPGDPLAPHREAMTAAARLAVAGKEAEAAGAYRKLARGAEGEYRTAFELLAGAASRGPVIGIIVGGVKREGPKRVYVDVAGRNQRAKLLSATTEQATISVSGSEMPLEWRRISARRMAGIASKYAGSAADHLLVAKFVAASGDYDSARKALEKALEAGLAGQAAKDARALGAVLR